MAHPETSLNLLLTNDEREAERLATQLEQYNARRRDLTARFVDIAMEQVMASPLLPAIIITYDDAYTPGINGLVAGRLTELFNRPAIALARADADHLVASARSVGDFSLIAAISQCADLLERYGGHQAAAGFTVRNDLYAEVANRLTGIANSQMGLFGPEPSLEIHAEGALDELLSPAMAELCARLEPFGKDNPTPRYLTRGARVTNAGYVGSNGQHLKLSVSSGGPLHRRPGVEPLRRLGRLRGCRYRLPTRRGQLSRRAPALPPRRRHPPGGIIAANWQKERYP